MVCCWKIPDRVWFAFCSRLHMVWARKVPDRIRSVVVFWMGLFCGFPNNVGTRKFCMFRVITHKYAGVVFSGSCSLCWAGTYQTGSGICPKRELLSSHFQNWIIPCWFCNTSILHFYKLIHAFHNYTWFGQDWLWRATAPGVGSASIRLGLARIMRLTAHGVFLESTRQDQVWLLRPTALGASQESTRQGQVKNSSHLFHMVSCNLDFGR